MTTKIINTSGKKKTAVARATFRKGSGRITINSKPLQLLQPELARMKVSEPLMIADCWHSTRGSSLLSTVDIDVNVHGGGFMGQAEASRTAIAKGLVEWLNDQKLRDAMIGFDRKILVSDHRRKWAKHFGGPGARAKRQKSYR